jgi:hypothetical protein
MSWFARQGAAGDQDVLPRRNGGFEELRALGRKGAEVHQVLKVGGARPARGVTAREQIDDGLPESFMGVLEQCLRLCLPPRSPVARRAHSGAPVILLATRRRHA